MSKEFQLVTRERPGARVFLRAVRDAAGSAGGNDDDGADILMDGGDFNDPNAYLSVIGYGLLIEIEPPGHVEAADLDEDGYGAAGQTARPEPDDEGCLWLTTARIPAGAPEASADVTWRVFQELASRYDGVAGLA